MHVLVVPTDARTGHAPFHNCIKSQNVICEIIINSHYVCVYYYQAVIEVDLRLDIAMILVLL